MSRVSVVTVDGKRWLRLECAEIGENPMLLPLTTEEETEILRGFGLAPATTCLDVDSAAQRIGEFATKIVVPPQLLIVIVSDVHVAAYRSNIVGGPARMPATLRELATKMERVGKS